MGAGASKKNLNEAKADVQEQANKDGRAEAGGVETVSGSLPMEFPFNIVRPRVWSRRLGFVAINKQNLARTRRPRSTSFDVVSATPSPRPRYRAPSTRSPRRPTVTSTIMNVDTKIRKVLNMVNGADKRVFAEALEDPREFGTRARTPLEALQEVDTALIDLYLDVRVRACLDSVGSHHRLVSRCRG